MDRTLALLLQTGRSIPESLDSDDTVLAPDPAARGWNRVSQIRGGASPAAPDQRAPGPVSGQAPSSLALRQFLATGSSVPPSSRLTGRNAARPAEPEQEAGDGSWSGAPAPALTPLGYQSVMGTDL